MANNKISEALEWDNVSIIGKGGSSTVYKAVSKPLGEYIAVKQIDIDGMNKDQITGIRAEIETMKSMSHPNIVSYLGMQLKPNKVFILMEFASLGSLRHQYQRVGPLPEEHVAYCLRQIIEGLRYLHSNGIAHRDVKCANCLISNSGIIKLADFGASKRFESESIVSGLKGTPHWMAPEVIKGTQMTSGWIKADVWSLGCTVVEMFTGKVPYAEYENPMTAMYKIANGEIPSLQPKNKTSDTLVPSSGLIAFVHLCCTVEPSARPTADDLSNDAFVCQSLVQDVQSYFKSINPDIVAPQQAVDVTLEENTVTHSEMFLPDEVLLNAPKVLYSSVDSVATVNNHNISKKTNSFSGLINEEIGEEQHYEDDWSEDESEKQNYSRCQTQQSVAQSQYGSSGSSFFSHLKDSNRLPSNKSGYELSIPDASVDNSTSFADMPTPLMGVNRKGMTRFDSDAQLAPPEKTFSNDLTDVNVRNFDGTPSISMGFEVPAELLPELQEVVNVEKNVEAITTTMERKESLVLSFDEANQVYQNMMSKYPKGEASGSVQEHPLEEARVSKVTSPKAVATAVVPNLSPVRIGGPPKVRQPKTKTETQHQPQPMVVEQQTAETKELPTRVSASSNKFGFNAMAAAATNGISNGSGSGGKLLFSLQPPQHKDNNNSKDLPRVSAIPKLQSHKEPVAMDVAIPSSSVSVHSPTNRSKYQDTRPNAPFSGEKLRIHTHNEERVTEKLSGAALRRKAAMELQEAQLATSEKQHPHHALLKIKPSHHLQNSSHHHHNAKPPKRARHERSSDHHQQSTNVQLHPVANHNSDQVIQETVKDLQMASRKQRGGNGASHTTRSHSAGVTSTFENGSIGTPQHRNRLPPVIHHVPVSHNNDSGSESEDNSAMGTNAMGARYIQSAPAVSRSMNLPPIKENVCGSKTPKLKPNKLGSISRLNSQSPSPLSIQHSTSSVELLPLHQVREE